MQICLLDRALRHAVPNNPFKSVSQILLLAVAPVNTSKQLLKLIRRASYHLPFKARVILILRRIAHFCFHGALTGGKYLPKPKIIDIKFYGIVLPTSADNV